MIKFHIPMSVQSNLDGYNYFGRMSQKLQGYENEKIVFDFSSCTCFEGNLCAILGGIFYNLIYAKNEVELENVNKDQITDFTRNGFLPTKDLSNANEEISSTISFKRFKISDESLIKDYIGKELLDRADMPKISSGLRNEIIRSIFEIYSNAVSHGECIEVFSCGHYFSDDKSSPVLNFTIVDLGKTIKHNVSTYLKFPKNGIEAIMWALIEGNTTKTGSIPGGLGLSLMQEFIAKNQGKIQIISADGYWEYSKGIISSQILNDSFEGTIVNLGFNLSDNNQYILASEVNHDLLF